MASQLIQFYSQDIPFKLSQKSLVRSWIRETILLEGYKLKGLNFIFCSDEYLLSINQQYLKHNTYTDIITFDNSEQEGRILGDIYISIDRVAENAETYQVSRADELHRVMIHGTLHLLGYPDKGKKAKALMTSKEDFYLRNRNFTAKELR